MGRPVLKKNLVAGSQKLKANNRTETIVLERISVARVQLNFKNRKVSGIKNEVTWCLQ